jgi:hypothetical protein
MPDPVKPVPALVITRAPIINHDGTASRDFLKILQDWSVQIANSLNRLGQFVGVINKDATISSRSDTIGTALSKIETGGILSTDNFTDGAGSPLAGGITAFQALVDSSPVSGNVLKYSGTDWAPGDAPGITELTGDGTAGPGSGSQVLTVVATHLSAPLPVDQGGSGTAAPSLVAGANIAITGVWPGQTVAAAVDFSGITGNLATAQLPTAGLMATIITAALTTGGTQGSMTFTNGILTAQTPAT